MVRRDIVAIHVVLVTIQFFFGVVFVIVQVSF